MSARRLHYRRRSPAPPPRPSLLDCIAEAVLCAPVATTDRMVLRCTTLEREERVESIAQRLPFTQEPSFGFQYVWLCDALGVAVYRKEKVATPLPPEVRAELVRVAGALVVGLETTLRRIVSAP